MSPVCNPVAAPATERTIFELLTEYHRSLESMRAWLAEECLDEVDRIAIGDAWQAEMREHFRNHGYCFGCNRTLARCHCAMGDL